MPILPDYSGSPAICDIKKTGLRAPFLVIRKFNPIHPSYNTLYLFLLILIGFMNAVGLFMKIANFEIAYSLTVKVRNKVWAVYCQLCQAFAKEHTIFSTDETNFYLLTYLKAFQNSTEKNCTLKPFLESYNFKRALDAESLMSKNAICPMQSLSLNVRF